MSPEEFSEIFPSLYHMAELGTWESIRRHGLLSTTALLDLYEISGKEREVLEDRLRREGRAEEGRAHPDRPELHGPSHRQGGQDRG